jgi:hypothetical protein
MKAQDFRRIAIALTGVAESSHMNHPDFRAGGRILWGRQGCTRVSLKSVDEDTLGEALTLAWKNITTK